MPKGWDKLFVSVVLVENGKTIAKSSKVPVRNGSCQWSDSFSESVLVSGDNSSKEIDECLLKLIVAMVLILFLLLLLLLSALLCNYAICLFTISFIS